MGWGPKVRSSRCWNIRVIFGPHEPIWALWALWGPMSPVHGPPNFGASRVGALRGQTKMKKKHMFLILCTLGHILTYLCICWQNFDETSTEFEGASTKLRQNLQKQGDGWEHQGYHYLTPNQISSHQQPQVRVGPMYILLYIYIYIYYVVLKQNPRFTKTRS